MHLDELIGVKRFQHATREELPELIGKKTTDVKMLGKGYFAHAFELHGKVYKFWLRDSAYEQFVEFVQHHKSPALPKFFSGVKQLTTFFNRPQATPKKIRYIKMEKLSPIDDTFQVMTDAGQEVNFPDTFMRALWLSLRADSEGSFNEEIRSRLKLDGKLLPRYQAFCDVAWQLGKTFKRNDLDIWPNISNVMWRGKQPVFTDPMMMTLISMMSSKRCRGNGPIWCTGERGHREA